MKVICFHNPDEENGYLSNWALSEFTVNGIIFSSMEQYMMYQKAVCFKDEEIAEKWGTSVPLYCQRHLQRGGAKRYLHCSGIR